jgi:hypothetical protein
MMATEEIYEEWILIWNEPFRNVNHSWGLFGLHFNSYYVDSGYRKTDPEYRTQGEMKEQEKFATAGKSPAKHKETMQKILQGLPKNGCISIDHLLEDRHKASSHERAKREWTVVAVRPIQKYPYGSAKKWGKDPKFTNWLVTIKGVTIDTEERSRSYERDDPWQKRFQSPFRNRNPISIRSRNRYRSPSPIRRRPIDEFVRNRPLSPLQRSLPKVRRSDRRPLSGTVRETYFVDEYIEDGYIGDGYVQGKVVVGKIMTRDEAEKKIEIIWAEMTGKVAETAVVESGFDSIAE